MSARHHPCQRGIAAIELTLVVGVCLVLLPAMLVFGRVFWHYSVLHKATHDAARYLSSVPLYELQFEKSYLAARTQAREMLIAALIAGRVDSPPTHEQIEVRCDQGCVGGQSAPLPRTITVTAKMVVRDNLFGDLMELIPSAGLSFEVAITVRHVH